MSGDGQHQKKKTKKDDSNDFGAFEKHTKGIGMKLLLKMGFKPGQGLGKDSEGRAAPVAIKLRPKGIGIGFSDDEDEKAEELVKEKKFKNTTTLQEKTVYKESVIAAKVPSKRTTTEQLKDNRQAFEIHSSTLEQLASESVVEIIDMQRDGLSNENNSNLSLRLLSQITIYRKAERLNLLQKRNELESLMRKIKNNSDEARKEQKRLKELEEENEVKRILNGLVLTYLTTESTIEEFCEDHNLKNILLNNNQRSFSLIEKTVMTILASKYDCKNVQLTARLAEILPVNLYAQLIYYYWWPQMRNPHFIAPFNDFEGWRGVMQILDVWSPLLPEEFLVSFLGYQVLMPRFHSFLNDDFSGETESRKILIKIWRMFRKQVRLSSDILESALKAEMVDWLKRLILQVSNGKFDEILLEFVEEWREGELLPRLDLIQLQETAWMTRIRRLLQRDLVIDPTNQDLSPLEGAFLALNYKIIDANHLSDLISAHLIPKLSRCVRGWLKSPQVDFEEVAEWYMAWKDLIPEELKEDEAVLNGFGTILSVINDHLT